MPAPVVQTFKRRRRMTSGQAAARERLSPSYVVTVAELRAGLPAVFGRAAPVALDVGFGMGDATAAMAAAEPGVDVLAVDVHAAGVGHLMRLADEAGVTNLRIVEADAREVLQALPPASLAAVRVFFPDPWPKTRHAKRRLVTVPFVELVADRLAPGGVLHVATDDEPYAAAVRAAVEQCTRLEPGAVPPGRPVTRYEQRARDAGRNVSDIVAVRRSPADVP